MTQGDRSALEGFFAELRRVWEEAGPPTYKEFEKLSKRFIIVLREAAREVGVDPARIGSSRAWSSCRQV